MKVLDRPTEIAELDSARSWLSKFAGRTTRAFSLTQNSEELAQIQTWLERDEGFTGGVRCRQTRVSFEDCEWTITTHSPSGPKRTRFLGLSVSAGWLKGERVVEVIDGDQRVAQLIQGRSPAVETQDGSSFALTRQGRHRLEAGVLTIEEVDGTYRLTTRAPLPLEAALLYWHLMLGDYVRPLPIA